jgi:DNA processing protein
MGFDPTGLDALQARTGMDTPTLQVQLLELEIEGLVMRLPGGCSSAWPKPKGGHTP